MQITTRLLSLTLLAAIVALTQSCATPSNTKEDSKIYRVNKATEQKLAAVKDGNYIEMEGDTDSDGLTDAEELTLGTDPYWPDSDNDRLPDGYEIANSLDPLVADTQHLEQLRTQIGQSSAEPGCEQFGELLHNPGCLMTGFNATTCKATCAGTCLGGTVSCYWAWGAFQYVSDKLAGAPCPGWTCHCP